MARFIVVALAILMMSGAASARQPAVLAAWLQQGPHGLELRAVVDGAGCPAITVTPRGPALERVGGFGGKGLCVAALGGATKVRLAGRALPAIPKTVERIVVIGDTGCRRETGKESCDPARWPFKAVAQAASREHAQLVIHVGDYFYRDFDCPASPDPAVDDCDTWQTWQTDFFAYAEPLLAEAPWLFIRGNHEDCFGRPQRHRGGLGWSRLLAPVPAREADGCVNLDAPYKVVIDGLSLVVVDTHAADDRKDDVVARYRGDFAAMFANLAGPAWLVMHRPVLGVTRDKNEQLAAGEPALLAALKDQIPASLQLQLSGHIHVFEALDYAGGLPPQLVVGNGGSAKEFKVPLPADLAAEPLPARDDGFSVAPGSLQNPTFGYVVMTRDARDRARWTVALKDQDRKTLLTCAFVPATPGPDSRLACHG